MFWRFNDVAPHGDVGAARCSWWRHLFCNSGGEQPHGTNGVQILSVSGASDLPLGMGLGWSISWGISGQSSSEAKGLRRCCSKGAEEVWPRACSFSAPLECSFATAKAEKSSSDLGCRSKFPQHAFIPNTLVSLRLGCRSCYLVMYKSILIFKQILY